MLKNQKLKGQVSIFVIIGVIMIIVTAFLYFNGKYDLFVSHDKKLKNQISGVVEDCIYDAADRGVFLLGMQGGYIDIPREIEANPFSYIDFGLKIPNWDTNRGGIPTIDSMEAELDRFVSEQAYSCIRNNLDNLSMFDIETSDEFFVESRINDGNVVLESVFDVRFNEINSEEILSVSEYYVKLENRPLGNLYELASEIYNLEESLRLFEELTIDQIMSANDYSSSESVPTEGMRFSCGKRIWTYPQLKRNIANMNNNNFKYLQFAGTYPKDAIIDASFNEELGTESYRDYFESHYTFYLDSEKDFSDYSVETFMPSIEITNRSGFFRRYPFREFEVSPSSGSIVEALNMEVDVGSEIPLPCVQIYHHLYTMDYDLVLKLKDMDDEGVGYTFQFPIRVEIYNNNPKERLLDPFEVEPSPVNSQSYCTDDSKQYPLKVIALDSFGNYLKDVNISYKCINYECDIGTTQVPDNVFGRPQPELVADFPFCYGGQVIGEKEGYHIAEERVNTDSSLLRREGFSGDNFIELDMIELKSFEVDIETFLMKIKERGGAGHRVYENSGESVYVSIENEENDFKSVAVWPNEGYLNKIEFLDMEDVAYNLSIIYMDSDYELRGMYERENWIPDVYGSKIQFSVPASENYILEDSFMEYYEYFKSMANDSTYDPVFY